jgi:hypothetical protein
MTSLLSASSPAHSPLHKVLAMSEIRHEQSPVQKALLIVDLQLARRKDVIDEEIVSKGCYDRAIVALREFRDVGQAGNPTKLTEVEDDQLLSQVIELSRTRASPSAMEVRAMVSFLLKFSFIRSVLLEIVGK